MGVMKLQQKHSSSQESHVIQGQLLMQSDKKLSNWPRVPDMNPIKNMLSEVQKTM
jgi:hypothetical protein